MLRKLRECETTVKISSIIDYDSKLIYVGPERSNNELLSVMVELVGDSICEPVILKYGQILLM